MLGIAGEMFTFQLVDYMARSRRLTCNYFVNRRFFKPVQVSEEIGPHFGMGLDCYVQWSSPIRRLTDLQVSVSIICILIFI